MKEETEGFRTAPTSKNALPCWKLGLLLVGVFFLALGVRVIYLDQIGAGSGGPSAGNVFYDVPRLDSANYHETALRILAGEETADGVLTYNPLYPVILSLLYRVMDTPDFHKIRLIQCVLGSLVCLLLVLLGRRFFDLRTGLIAALAAVFYGPFLFFDGELIQSTWILFCLSLSFLVLPLATARKGAAGIALCLLAGGLFGIGLLGRPNLLLFLVFFCLWLPFRPVGARNEPLQRVSWLPRPVDRRVLRDSFLIGILVWVGALAVIAPVTIRNLVKGGEFVLTTAHGGINFYIGNNPNADGWYKTPDGFEGSQEGLVRSGRAIAEGDTGRSMSHSEVSRHWFGKGRDYLIHNPGAAAGLFFRKLYLFWHAYEKPLEGNVYYLEAFSPLLRFTLGFGAVAPFALLGIVLALRKWWSGGALVAFFVLVYSGTLVLFFVTSRYRIVAVPFLLLLGAWGGWWCFERLRAAQWKPLAGAVVLLAATAVLSNSFLFGLEGCEERDLAYSYYDAGNVHLSRGENGAADRSYSKAIALNRDVPYFYGNRGIALNKLGRYDAALSVYEIFARRWPGSPQARYGLASTFHVLGRLGEAEKEYRAALAIRPLHADTLENLARICESTGRNAEARALRQRAAGGVGRMR